MSTHFFHSGMTGAPTNTNAAGSTLAIIDACLNTGFNVLPVLSATVSSGVMTLTYATTHGYEALCWIRLDGAPGGSIMQRCAVPSGATLTMPAPGFADGPVSGTLSTRVAPTDWERPFSNTNVGVFRSKVVGPGSTRFFYRVADTVSGPSPAMLRGYESMSDANTGIGPFPTVAQESGNGLSVLRAIGATQQPWFLVADQRTVYLHLIHDASNRYTNFFGDEQNFGSTDVFMGSCRSNASLAQAIDRYRPRLANGTGTSSLAVQRSFFGSTSLAYPSPIDGGMVLMRPVLTHDQGTGTAIRGIQRGLLQTPHLAVPSGSNSLVLDNVSSVSGRVLLLRDQGGINFALAIDEDWP